MTLFCRMCSNLRNFTTLLIIMAKITIINLDELPSTVVTQQDEVAAAWVKEMNTLHKYNLYCGSLHAVQGFGVLIFSFVNSDASNMLIPITSLYCNWDVGYPVQAQGLVTYFNYVRMASLFSIISAAAHFTVLFNWDRYTKDLAQGRNRFRWWEYSLSSSLILCLLTNMWGNYDFV